MQVLKDFKKTVSEIVRSDYRTADVFKKHGINYCCGGQVPLEEACLNKKINYDELVEELDKATKGISLPNTLQYDKWKMDFLIDYIVNVHHAYINIAMPLIQANVISFVNSHKKQYPELEEVQDVFEQLCAILTTHNLHEEATIFPYIKQIETTHRRKEIYGSLFVRTLRKPLSEVEKEHSKMSELLGKLRQLTNDYSFPENACTNHRVVFNKLREFDNDLVQHKHLENNILFPKAIEMERELLQQSSI
jgi:regulator of cell morphogenesis and NO signaling